MNSRLDDYDRNCQKIIAEHGWMIQGVFPTEADPGVPFAYTVGLTVTGLPELVMAGLDFDTMHSLLNSAAQHAMGAELRAGEVLEGIATVSFRVVEAPSAEVNMARHLYGRDKVTALQLAWPTAAGNYPGDAGWTLGDAQPIYA